MVQSGLISIIVPVYNVEKYLEKCIDSILAQTYSNMEILLIDDGSTDASGIICDNYAIKDNRIKVIHRENKGVAYTRNEGLDLANGEYITFVDSDDYVNPRMYELMIQSLKKNNAQIVTCDYKRVQQDENIVSANLPHENAAEEVLQTKNDKLEYIYLKHYGEATLLWNKIYRSELWKDIRCPIGKVYEDETLTFRVLYYADKIVCIHADLYYHVKRKDDTSITDKGFSLRRLTRLDALEYRMDFFAEKQEWRFLAEALFAYKTDFLVIMEHIMKSSEYTIDILKPYFVNYRRYCRKYLGRIEVSFKNKLQYIFFAVSPELYYSRFERNGGLKK